MCPIGTVTFRLAAQVPPPSRWKFWQNFDSVADHHGPNMLTMVTLPWSMLVMGVSGLISTFHCVTRESIPCSVEAAHYKKQEEDEAPLCSSLKSTSRQFLHLFERRNKQTNRLQHLTVLRLCLQFVTILLCCWAGSQAWANPLFVWNTNGQPSLSLT